MKVDEVYFNLSNYNRFSNTYYHGCYMGNLVEDKSTCRKTARECKTCKYLINAQVDLLLRKVV